MLVMVTALVREPVVISVSPLLLVRVLMMALVPVPVVLSGTRIKAKTRARAETKPVKIKVAANTAIVKMRTREPFKKHWAVTVPPQVIIGTDIAMTMIAERTDLGRRLFRRLDT